MNQYKAAIVGYGNMGRWHHVGICGNVGQVAFKGAYDTDPQRCRLAEQDGLAVYSSREELLGDKEIDIVLVATPNPLHKEITCAALKAGKSVICEKPASMNARELARMIKTAKKTGRVFSVHHNRRRDPDYAIIKHAVQNGLAGNVFDVKSTVFGSLGVPGGWRRSLRGGGGMLYDWGPHLIDQVLQLFPGVKVISVDCKLYHVRFQTCDDGFSLFLTFENGTTASIEVGTSHYVHVPRWYLFGDKGSLVIEDWECNGKRIEILKNPPESKEITYSKAGPTRTMAPREKDTYEETIFHPEDDSADYGDFYRNFADALDGKAALDVKPEEILRVMKIVDTAFKSDRKRQIIHVKI
ncbi:MAG: Gfo/Idh/MocA family oxidoreductase [Desulfovibrionaceae bacterium]|nr:Gfo/Idh/MocA family oxidoreductase [Desulfovibrionaceae bacterium]